MQENNSYKESLKATSLFGGVQVFNILIQLIRSKVIALLIGPAGMGVYGLFSQTDALIKSFTSFGLSSSAVKNISEANGSGDSNRVLAITTIFRKIVWATGLLGMSVCLFGSSLWSKFTFGDEQYTIGFAILSLSMLFQQLAQGQIAILQGLRKYAYMAKANVYGNVIGLCVTIPLYYIWKINAVVPVMVISTLVTLVLSWLFYRKLDLKMVQVPKQMFISESKNMLLMGMSISLSGTIGTALAYYLRVYIGEEGGLSEVGLFTSGFSIVETYIGLVMTSMGTDYYPRLASVNTDHFRFQDTINSQLGISLALISPLIASFIILIDILIVILYSSDFLPAESMMVWAIYGCVFKVISWCIAFGILAKGDYKMFLVNELLANAYGLPAKIIGYKFLGIQGIGIAYMICFIIYAIQVMIICNVRYKYNIDKSSLKVLAWQFPILTSCLIISSLSSDWVRYLLGVPFILLSIFVSLKAIQSKVDVKSLVLRKFRK